MDIVSMLQVYDGAFFQEFGDNRQMGSDQARYLMSCKRVLRIR